MRKLIARYVIRRTWKLCLKVQGNPGYPKLGEMFNTLSLITTALGGHSGWFPKDVIESYRNVLRENGAFKSVSKFKKFSSSRLTEKQ